MALVAAGIDPGGSGAIAILSDPIETYIVPKIGTKTDWKLYAELFKKLDNCFAGLEEVHAIYGASAKATFTFGGYFYAALCLLHSNKVKHELIRPQKWQKEIWSNTDKVFKPNKRVDTKATSLMAARRLYPDMDFLYGTNERRPEKSKRSKPHDGIIDALLIAEYIKRINN